jgi:hypothetical protein
MINLLSVFGILYDIVGAILIAAAIVGTREEMLIREARPGGQFSSVNLALFAALENQRHDAWFGLSFLVVGFVLQLVAAFGFAIELNLAACGFAMTSGLAVLAWWYLRRELLSATRRDRVAESLEGVDRLNFLTRNPEPRRSQLQVFLMKFAAR